MADSAEARAIRALEQVQYVLGDWPQHQIHLPPASTRMPEAIVADTAAMMQDWIKLRVYVISELEAVKALRSKQCEAQR